MRRRGCLAVLLVVTMWGTSARVDVRADTPDLQLFRVFLTDGTSIASYGEWARVGDRVVFSMPIGELTADPALQLVNLPAARVDWLRTERYAEAARYARYATVRGEADFTELSGEIARVLNEVALSPTPERGLQLAEQARRTLTEWPRQHYGYRQADVREILALLDEAVSELRATVGQADFDLNLVAMAPAPPGDPLLPAPSPSEQVQQLMGAARQSDVPADRVALLQTAVGLIDRLGLAKGSGQIAGWRAEALRMIEDEVRTDRTYAELVRRMDVSATRAAARADVGRVERVLEEVRTRDAKLGGRRREQVDALVARVQAHLDAARALRLARDRWTLRASAYRTYQRAMTPVLLSVSRVQASLDAIKRLAGPDPAVLASVRARLEDGVSRLRLAAVPPELQAAHDLLLSAWQLAQTATQLRQDAVLAADLVRARDASTAAAGALRLFDRAQRELRTLLEPPRLR